MKIAIKTTLFLVLFAWIFTACQEMEDIHADFIKGGEKIYAAVPDTVIVMPGDRRLQLKWLVNHGANIKKSVVEWTDNGQEFSKSVDVNLTSPLDSVMVLLDNLEEKSYIFKTYNIDKDGNRSIKVQVAGLVFGEIYKSSITNRIITSITGGGTVDSVVVNWRLPNEGNTGVELSYKSRSGEMVKKWVKPEDTRTVLRNWESLGTMTYKSFYIPTPTAIDTFVTATTEVGLPQYIEFKGVKLDKTNWVIKDFSTEEPAEGAPNGLASSAIDGKLNTFWHSQWNGASPGYPHHFTIDLKSMVKLSKVEVFRRQGDNRGQTQFQILTSLDGTNFVSQGIFEYDRNVNSASYNLVSLPLARYVRYVATQGPNFFAFLAEIDLYGQVAAPIERTNWSVVGLSSEEPKEATWGPPIQGLAAAAIDGVLSTFWHSAWDQSQPPYPHYFTVDMKKKVRLMAVECFRRQGNNNGQTEYKIYTSNDGLTFTDQGTFTFNSKINDGQVAMMANLPEARYVKYEATKGPNHYAFLAEFVVYGEALE